MFLERRLHRPLRHSFPGTPLWLFGFVFVLGVALGNFLPRDTPWRWPTRAAIPAIPVETFAAPSTPSSGSWRRDGNPGVRHGVDVVRVIDGDTFEAQVHLWPGLEMTTRVRLRGIDAPEMKSACADELRMAEAATDALRAMLAQGDVAIFNIGPDKYNGRVVADASTRQTPSVSNALLAAGHARAYQGGRRSGWCAKTG